MQDVNSADVAAGATATAGLVVTLAHVQSTAAIVASSLSALYFIVRILNEPSVKRFLKKFFRS